MNNGNNDAKAGAMNTGNNDAKAVGNTSGSSSAAASGKKAVHVKVRMKFKSLGIKIFYVMRSLWHWVKGVVDRH